MLRKQSRLYPNPIRYAILQEEKLCYLYEMKKRVIAGLEKRKP